VEEGVTDSIVKGQFVCCTAGEKVVATWVWRCFGGAARAWFVVGGGWQDWEVELVLQKEEENVIGGAVVMVLSR